MTRKVQYPTNVFQAVVFQNYTLKEYIFKGALSTWKPHNNDQ